MPAPKFALRFSFALLAAVPFFLLPAGRVAAGTLSVHTDFPSGSGNVVLLDQQTRHIRLGPTEHPERGWACWWYIRVEGIEPGETLTLEVTHAPWATPARAAVSLDNAHWEQTMPGHREDGRMTYRHQVDADTAWFAWGPPYPPSRSEMLIASLAGRPLAQRITLCQSREGNSVPGLRLGKDDAPRCVWIQARQHAWEAGSSWVCEGMMEWLASEDPHAVAARQEAQFTLIPIMDVDNVLRGAGGKNQTPHDHNRDWSEQPHWPEVAAAIEQLKELDRQQRLALFIDLHNPGPGNQRPYFYVAPDSLLQESGRRNLQHFLALAQQMVRGPLAYEGETIESGPKYDANWARISKNWVTHHSRPGVVAVTLETPWNTPHSTIEGYRTVGRQLAQAAARYLAESKQ